MYYLQITIIPGYRIIACTMLYHNMFEGNTGQISCWLGVHMASRGPGPLNKCK